MAIYQVWYGGPAVNNANGKLLPNVPVTADMLLGPPLQRQAAYSGLSRVLDFGTRPDGGDLAFRDWLQGQPLADNDELVFLAVPKHSLIRGAFWQVENASPLSAGSSFEIRSLNRSIGTFSGAANGQGFFNFSGYGAEALFLYPQNNDIRLVMNVPPSGQLRDVRITLGFDLVNYTTGQF